MNFATGIPITRSFFWLMVKFYEAIIEGITREKEKVITETRDKPKPCDGVKLTQDLQYSVGAHLAVDEGERLRVRC